MAKVSRSGAALALLPVLGLALSQGTAGAGTAAAPNFQVPFPCQQVWTGTTFSGHNPPNSVDFNRSDDEGDPVLAAAAGTVSRVENEGDTSYGRWIEIDHGSGWTTRYAHLSSQDVRVGAKVAQAALIGKVGNTGGSTGPHLHFEELSGGEAVKITFGGKQIHYWGERDYTSANGC